MSTTTDKLNLTKMEQTDTMAAWMTAHNGNAEILDGVLGLVYPVGSIYMSVNSTSPATLFGGTWEAIGGKFLIGANSSHSAGSTGGSETKTIAETNLPSHSHSLNGHKHSIGAHNHGLNSHKHSIGAHSHGLNSHVHSVGAHSHGLNSHTHSYNAPANHTHTITLNAKLAGGSNQFWVPAVAASQSATAPTQTTSSSSASTSATTGAATGNTANSSAFNTGAASGSTANSTAFDSGAASGSTANSTAFDSGAASGNTGATGGGTALNVMPPFLSVYMWKRTA